MSAKKNGKFRVAAIGDLHVGRSSEHPYRDMFQEISDRADALALCGDLTNIGSVQEAEILAEDLRACRIPVVAVFGNHDYECGCVEEVQKILTQAGVRHLGEEPQEFGGVGFAGVKGFAGGFGSFMLGAFGEKMIKDFVGEAVQESLRLENQLHILETEKTVVVLHYAPVAATVEGEPKELWPFLGSSRLAETIDRFDHVSAVFHGHAHHGSHRGQTPKGTPVYNACQFVPREDGKRYTLVEL